VLHYVDGLSPTEISEVLDVAESTVRTHLQRGREAVTAALDTGGDLP
jgi:DNA-directed RNA polymerase specialized sigma24 family protein